MEEEIKIKYLIEAEDKASKEIDKIDKSLGNMKKSMAEVDKLQSKQDNQTKSTIGTFGKLAKMVSNVVSSIKDLWLVLISIDLAKISKLLFLLSFIFKLKGHAKMAAGFYNIAVQVGKVNLVLEGMQQGIEKLKEISGSVFSYILDKVESVVIAIAKWSAGVAVLGATFAGLLASKAVVDVLAKSIVALKGVLFDLSVRTTFTFGTTWPKSTKLATKGIGSMIGGLNTLQGGVIGAQKTLSGYLKTTKDVGGTMYKALNATEALEKGFYGLVTRVAIGSSALGALGNALVRSDSLMLKLAGGALLGLAIALGGIVVVLRQVIMSIGVFIQNVGQKLTSAVQSSIDKMNKLTDSTYTFGFIVGNLAKETDGATGSLEEWNSTMQEFTKTTGYSATETQKSVSEMLRFGESIGLTKKQMEEMLPIIGDLAEANHKDLFSSTLAVVEALNGQGVMLQNMGVNLGAHALAETKAGKAIGGHITKLKDAEKVQLRYAGLLEKTTTVKGIAAASANTLTGAQRRLNTQFENASLAIGSGAAIIEGRYNIALFESTKALVGLSKPLLAVIGFFGALFGRVLQGIGIFLQFSFSIILLVSSLKALNVLLASNAIGKFLVGLSNFKPIMTPLAALFPQMTAGLQTMLVQLAKSGAGIKSFGALVKITSITFIKAIGTMIAPMLPVIAVIASIVATGYIFYKAMELIESKTGVFSTIASEISEWWNSAGAMQYLTEKMAEFGEVLTNVVSAAVLTTAQLIVGFMSGMEALSTIPIIVARAFIDMGTSIMDTWKNITASIDEFVGGAPKALLGMLGITTEVTDKLADMYKKTEEFDTASSDLGKGYLAGVEENIIANDRLIASLGQVGEAKIIAGSAGERGPAGNLEEELTLIQAFNQAKLDEQVIFQELEAAQKELGLNKDFALVQKTLGKEYATREALKAKHQMKEGKLEEAKSTLLKLHTDARKKMAEDLAKKQVEEAKKAAARERAIEQAKYQTASNYLQAGIALAKDGSAVAKGLAIAQATMNVYRTISSVFADPLLTAYEKPILATSYGVLASAQIAKIAGVGFYQGGIVDSPSRVGDNNPVNVNGGEMILTGAQQSELFAMARGNNSGGNENNGEQLDSLTSAINTQPIVVQIDGREIARTVRNQISGGFRLA